MSLKDLARQPRAWLAAFLAVATSVGLVVVITDNDHDGRPDAITVTIHKAAAAATVTVPVNQPGNGPAPAAAPDSITVPKAAVDAAAQVLETGLRDASPQLRAAAPKQFAAMKRTIDHVKETRDPLPIAGASGGFPGCVTRFVRNQSSRNGARPIWMPLHYTVTHNVPGWDDVWAVVAGFDNASNKTSSSFVIDREGHCAYIVPIENKPWTQVAGNPLSISFEIIDFGTESSYLDVPGYAKLRSVMREVSRRTGIPMRRGSVYPPVPGIVQHKDGGIAWGGHVDITPFNVDQVVKILTAGAPADKAKDPLQLAHYRNAKHLTAGEHQTASCLLTARRAARKTGSWSKTPTGALARARQCKAVLEDRVDELKALPPRRGAHRSERRTALAHIVRATA